MNTEYESMSEDELNHILLEFSNSTYYPAYLEYLSRRYKIVNDALRSLDPFREPTQIARNQGIGMGLWDLRDSILILNKRSADAEEQDQKK